MPTQRRSPEAQSQMFDVRLLDMFAEVEALLRGCRELQRDALKLRGVAPTNNGQRNAATRRMQKRIGRMRKGCRTLCGVVEALAKGADDLRKTEAV